MSRVDDPEKSLPYHLRGAFRGFETALGRYIGQFDLPLSYFYILRLLWDDAGSSQKDIAEKAFMTESVASQVIQKMEKSGFLERKVDPNDGRQRRVCITKEGLKMRQSILAVGLKLSSEHSPVTDEDMKTTMRVLIEVRKAFEAYNKMDS